MLSAVKICLVDFQLMQQANVIFRSASTFSQWAAWLAQPLQKISRGELSYTLMPKIYSPDVGDRVGLLSDVKFVRGNHPPLISQRLHPDVIHTGGEIKE